MKIVVQRSLISEVLVDEIIVGKIEKGLVLLVCIEREDTSETMLKAATKVLNLRIFEDKTGKMTSNIIQAQGQILAVSQFTLSWNGKGGHRPSFDLSMPPQEAKVLFKIFCDAIREHVDVETGRFGQHMCLNIQNDGPVTFNLSF
jgi:D-tyrosyl-tRNA(Tyr) deacylase